MDKGLSPFVSSLCSLKITHSLANVTPISELGQKSLSSITNDLIESFHPMDSHLRAVPLNKELYRQRERKISDSPSAITLQICKHPKSFPLWNSSKRIHPFKRCDVGFWFPVMANKFPKSTLTLRHFDFKFVQYIYSCQFERSKWLRMNITLDDRQASL